MNNNRITGLEAEGSLDTSFSPSAGASVNAIAVQSNGKILIGGDFTYVNGQPRNRMARLNTDGSLDGTFNPSGIEGAVYSIAVQANDKVLIGGAFTSVGVTGPIRIARLNADGSLDSSFAPNTGATGGTDPTVYSVTVQTVASVEKVLIGGGFTTVNGTTRNGIARLNANGSLDTSFSPGSGVGGSVPGVRSVAIQSDGNILIGGSFTTVAGNPRKRLARLTAGGGLDGGFNAELNNDNVPDDSVLYSIAVQSDGNLLIGGSFTKVKGTTAQNPAARNRIARLLSDGSLDDSFRPSTAGLVSQCGPNNAVRTLAIAADGLILIGGDFAEYAVATAPPSPLVDPIVDSILRKRIARIAGQ